MNHYEVTYWSKTVFSIISKPFWVYPSLYPSTNPCPSSRSSSCRLTAHFSVLQSGRDSL